MDVEGGQNVLFGYVLVHAGVGWEVFMVSAAGPTERDDRAFFETFIATFKFTK